MSRFVFYKTCAPCNGTGQVPNYPTDSAGPTSGTVSCPDCDGVGENEAGEIDLSDLEDAISDLTDDVSDVMDKCNDIFEIVDDD